MPFVRAVRFTGIVLVGFAVLLLLAGGATLYGSDTSGDLLSIQHAMVTPGSQRMGPRAGGFGGSPLYIDRAEYRYEYEGASYTSTWICVCLPVGVLEKRSEGQAVTIYVMPWWPSLSVLIRGPDYFLVGLVAFLGWTLIYFASRFQIRDLGTLPDVE